MNEAIKLRLINLRDRAGAIKHFTQRISSAMRTGIIPAQHLDKLCINLARINYLGKSKKDINEIIVETLELVGEADEGISAALLDGMEGYVSWASRIKKLWPLFATLIIQLVMRWMAW